MTENKRFTLSYTYGILDNGEQMEDLSNVCECLNNLHKENQALKSAYGEMEDYLARLEEENEQLKKDNETLRIYLEQANSTDKESDCDD